MVLQLVSSQPPLDAAELLQRARTEKTLDFDLGTVDVSAPSTEAFFLDMAELRRERYFGFKFRCSVRTGITAGEAMLLGKGGVTSAQVLTGPGKRQVGTDVPLYLTQLEAVRTLFQAGLDVQWDLAWTEDMRDPPVGGELLRTLAAACNLPPPGLTVDEADGAPCEVLDQLRALISAWPSRFRRAALTFARGPGFMRIRDRRAVSGRWKFYTLKGQQADILLFCAQVRSRADIAGSAGGVPPERLSAFLDRMVASELMCRHGENYMSLPTRRTLDERWSSEVL